MSRHLFLKCASYPIWLLKPWMFSNQKLNALMLEVIVHDRLVVPCNTNSPLLKFPHNTLASLLCDSRDVTVSAGILKWKLISILDPDLLHCVIYRTRWPASKNRIWILNHLENIWFAQIAFIILLNLAPHILILFPYEPKNLFNRSHRNLCLGDICSV